ncbi:MAG: radical SAM family heme chaperone HemW [Gaiellales bacterium]|mgnify:FL=1|nr:radical SAM family heme chaperone HemW [Gaiellales bacterium]
MGSSAADPAQGRAHAAPATVRHLYVHLPFCRSRCAYCDFYAEAVDGRRLEATASRYVTALTRELAEKAALTAHGLDTVYLGGGTPTHLPQTQLRALLEAVRPLLLPGAEVTVEANPGTINAALLAALRAVGVTRVSLGIQSFHRELRANLGRRVSDREVRESVRLLRASPGLSWNVDLVLGIPGQHRRLLEADLESALTAAPSHISLYDLTYTPRYEAFLARRLGPAAAGRARRASEGAYHFAVDLLEHRGFRRYEVSNFARLGCECRHNLGYWRGEDYLGLGAGATSTVGLRRWKNPDSWERYLEAWTAFPVAHREAGVEEEPLTPEVKCYEAVMLGLRTREGVHRRLLQAVADREQLDLMLRRGLVREQRDKIALSAGGLDVSNFVLSAILLPPPVA